MVLNSNIKDIYHHQRINLHNIRTTQLIPKGKFPEISCLSDYSIWNSERKSKEYWTLNSEEESRWKVNISYVKLYSGPRKILSRLLWFPIRFWNLREQRRKGERNSSCRWSAQLDRRDGQRMQMGQQGLISSELVLLFLKFSRKNDFLSWSEIYPIGHQPLRAKAVQHLRQ